MTVSVPANASSPDDIVVLNFCAKLLGRTNVDGRNNFGQFDEGDARGNIAEAYRFPIVDTAYASDGTPSASDNKITFVFEQHIDDATPVSVVGTFDDLYRTTPLRRVMFRGKPMRFLCASVTAAKGVGYVYKFVVNGATICDPINPQRVVLDNGAQWSRFFTHQCTDNMALQQWEFALLQRITDQILPFRTPDAENFLKRFYTYLDDASKSSQYALVYRLDQPIGVVNYIDNVLAREEAHRLTDYRICLLQMKQILRARFPGADILTLPEQSYLDLYNDMSSGKPIDGWDYLKYGNPGYFLQMLRRHAYTGAFSHPKYGGNSGAMGWRFLGERFELPPPPLPPGAPPPGAGPAPSGGTAFDWSRAIEPPIGTSLEYRG